jgi:small GTP-binding protein
MSNNTKISVNNKNSIDVDESIEINMETLNKVQNNINIVILGGVSVGKSTLLNALLSKTCSDTKRKKATMLIQRYQTSHDKTIIDSINDMYLKNKNSNEEILLKRENNTFDYSTDFKEIVHHIDFLKDFITLPDENATYSIIDSPGLNDGKSEIYYDYIESIADTIDIYILVFDINSGLNTSDEIIILDFVIDKIAKNKNKYVHILLNKCDDIDFDSENNVKFEDEELQELYNRSVDIINSKSCGIESNISISPISTSKLYTFRGIQNNIDTVDESHLDKMIKDTCGSLELKNLKRNILKKKKLVLGLMNNENNGMVNNFINNTGYTLFLQNLSNIMKKYGSMIYDHIYHDILDLHDELNNLKIKFFVFTNTLVNKNVISGLDELNTNFLSKIKIIDIKISNNKKYCDLVPQVIIDRICNIGSLLIKKLSGIHELKINGIDLIEQIELFCLKYVDIIKKYDNANSFDFIKEKKQTLQIFKFVTMFDYDLFVIVKNYINTKNFRESIISSFTNKNIFEFRNIYNLIKSHDCKEFCVILKDEFLKYNNLKK